MQKDGRKARKKIIDTIRSSLLSKHKKNSSMGARVSQKKPAWAESNSDTDIDDDEDIDNIMDTDGELKPNDGENYSLVVTGKKKNDGSFKMRWKRSPWRFEESPTPSESDGTITNESRLHETKYRIDTCSDYATNNNRVSYSCAAPVEKR